MKKNIYEILKQSFYEINQHYLKYISALALQAFLLVSALLFLPPFGIVLAFIVMIITQIGLAKYSLKILSKKQEQIKDITQINKFTFSHIITFIIKTFQIIFFSLFLIVPGFIKCLEYSQTDFILAENEKLDTAEALLESKKLTHNSKGRVLMLFITHFFISAILIAFSGSVVILTSTFIHLSRNIMLIWFSVMSVFLLAILAMPYYTISRTILYENLKTLSKFNKTPEKNFFEEVAQEFITAFKPRKKIKQEIKPETQKNIKKPVKNTKNTAKTTEKESVKKNTAKTTLTTKTKSGTKTPSKNNVGINKDM